MRLCVQRKHSPRENLVKPTKHFWHQREKWCFHLSTLFMSVDMKCNSFRSDTINTAGDQWSIGGWIWPMLSEKLHYESKLVMLKFKFQVQVFSKDKRKRRRRQQRHAWRAQWRWRMADQTCRTGWSTATPQSELFCVLFSKCVSLWTCEIKCKSSNTTARIESVASLLGQKLTSLRFNSNSTGRGWT